ncbi:hypothetical protein [Nocardia sp. NBC_01329]|uniref:hypothetical protein n=1 Tax=Nocardia sp. NBC_01329 TaxID=2903594 RepID=UPI002E100A18|nr:hypothetical protein OG405_10810 [Nocardia sp. NBC_01329]
MTIHITDWLMTSAISPEFAERVQTRHGSWWQLSWLPGRYLSFDQAYAGMAVDETLSDPALIHDEPALARAVASVDLMGLVWEQVIVLLAQRVEARLLEAEFMNDRIAPGASYRDDPGAVRSGTAA